MAVGREIRGKIKSVKNTQKITRAMEMVAASKMRKAQDRMNSARPYAEKMRNVIGHMARAHAEYKHPYLMERDAKRVGFIVISSDRGLCGGLNSNMFRATVLAMRDWRANKVEIDLCPIGAKAGAFFRRHGGQVLAKTSHLGDTPEVADLIGTVKVMLDAYSEGQIDRLFMVYNRFINTMTQRAEVEQLLPLPPAEDERLEHHWDYLYEPEAKEVMETILGRYIESLVYQGVVENLACEQAARMVAMKNASDNAGKLIDELQLAYNKARQAAITTELADIVGGAAAVS